MLSTQKACMHVLLSLIYCCSGITAGKQKKCCGMAAINTVSFCRGYYHRLLAPYLQDIQLQAEVQQTGEPVHSKAGKDDMQDDDRRAEADGSEPAVSAKPGDTVEKGGLDVSAIQQHSAVISARLQSRPDVVDMIDTSESEDPLDQPPPLPADFKATVVDASGPIPGLEDL